MPRRKFNSRTATKPFVGGFTLPWNSPQTVDLLTYTDYSSLSAFFSSHHIDHGRFPGGTQGVFFLYNDKQVNGYWLSDEANAILNQCYATRDFAPVSSRDRLLNGSPWIAFLKMCAGSALRPIVMINTLFYVYSDVLYPIEELNIGPYADFGVTDMTLDATRWSNPNKIQKYVQDQVKSAHANYTGNIIWELGNENASYYNAETYAAIVERFIPYVKNLYPGDQVIVSMTKGMVNGEGADNWNTNLISALNTASLLSSIDFFAVHYYPTKNPDYAALTFFDADGTLRQDDIDTRVEDTWFNSDIMAAEKAYFDSYSPYTPKFSLTEYLILESTTLQNTQLHGILMLDALFKFRKEPTIASVSKHTGPLIKNGMFFGANANKLLAYMNITLQSDSVPFPYVTPVCKAAAAFLDILGDTFSSYSLNDTDNGLEILITKTGIAGYVHILNYKDAASVDFDTSSWSASATFTQWKFPSLSSNFWDEVANKATGKMGDTMTLPPHSLTVIYAPLLFD